MIGESEAKTESLGASLDEFEALQTVIAALRARDMESRKRILESAATFLDINLSPRAVSASSQALHTGTYSAGTRPQFSEDTSMSPKDFLNEKSPKTDVERIACLAYYLTHYKSTPHFKTLDLSLLNTEAAQPKFANTAYSANNAVKMGYLVPASKGQRQLSAMGERFVRALPDRTAAKDVLVSIRRRSRSRRKRGLEDQGTEE
jgi:hypothetical protein